MTTSSCDLAVIGAGPAGLEAAIAAAGEGLSVTVLDLGERIGGQYFRHAPGHVDPAFAGLHDRFASHITAGRIVHRARHAVWSIEPGFRVHATEGEREREPRTVTARAVIVATGAHDRHIPFPGWTLPGVMAGGGAQALLKGSLVAGGRRAVVAGTGPFLLPVACGLRAAGVAVLEVVEANDPRRIAGHPLALAGAIPKLPEAALYAAQLTRHRVPFRTRHAVIAAHGGQRLESVTIARIDADWRIVTGSERRIACDLLAVGYGFTPQIDLALALGCAGAPSANGLVALAADSDGRTSVPGVYAAGETTGVGGADLALVEGRLCGAAVAHDLGCRPAPSGAMRRRLLARRGLLRRFAAALHAVHPVRGGWSEWLDDETLVCRCEEVPYARLCDAVRNLGAADPRAVKLLARPGMGWCQGRICGSAVAELTAQLSGRPVTLDDLVALSRRSLGQPVSLALLATLDLPGRDPSDPH